MSTYNLAGVSPIQLNAEATVTQYKLVKFGTAASSCIHTTAIADIALGVALRTVASGTAVPVQIAGVAQIIASAAVSVGAEVMCTASGDGKCSTSSGATSITVGIALTAALADGDVIEVLLCTPNCRGPLNT